MDEYTTLKTAAEKSDGRNVHATTTLFRFMRQHRVRDPDAVVELGRNLLASRQGALGDELWTVLEQVFLAALDVYDPALLDFCLGELKAKFPESTRVERLRGMLAERQGEFGEADCIYTTMLEANPCNALAMKRQVCVLKAQGKLVQAIHQLNTYLKTFSGDPSAWQELAELYLSVGKYEAAAFCLEELVLINPTNHNMHTRLGEVYYTMGDQHLRTARKYFAQSLDLKRHNNLRATHGLAQCCYAISQSKDRETRADLNAALHATAAEELTAIYGQGENPLALRVGAMIDAQRSAIQSAAEKD